MLAFKQMCILFITMVSLDFWKTVATSAGELPLTSLVSRPRAVMLLPHPGPLSCSMWVDLQAEPWVSENVTLTAPSTRLAPGNTQLVQPDLGGPEAAVLGWNMAETSLLLHQPPGSWP